MKKVIIKNLQGIQTHGAKFEAEIEMQSWIDDCVKIDCWGKKAGFYPLSQLSEAELATEISRVVMNDMGELLQDPQVEIPAQYTIEIEDKTVEENDKKEAHKAKKKKIKDLMDKEVLDSDDIQKALKILLNNL